MQVTPQRRRRSSSFGPLARDSSPCNKADDLLEQTPRKLLGRSRSQVFEDETADPKKSKASSQEQAAIILSTIAEEPCLEQKAAEENKTRQDKPAETSVICIATPAEPSVACSSKSHAESTEQTVPAETPMVSIDGEQYKVLDTAAFAELIGKLSGGQSQPSTAKPKRTMQERSLTELRRQQAAARQETAEADMDVACPGTPPQGQKRCRSESLERDCESQKQRSPRVRLAALARAFAVASASAAAEPSGAQLEKAIRNFESFHGLAAGTARADDVANSSAGISGWAEVSSGLGENSFPRVTFSGPNIAEEIKFDAMRQNNLVPCR